MKQICYVSFLKDDLNVHDVINSIRNISSAKNSKHGITGMLVYSNEVFIQILEGMKMNVDITYKIIESDDRHQNIKVLFEQDINERCFPDWAMRFEYSETLNLNALNKVLNFQGKNIVLNNEEIYDLFKGFLEEEEKTPD
jgi:hypothetical protein